jgi:hypothetical protein
MLNLQRDQHAYPCGIDGFDTADIENDRSTTLSNGGTKQKRLLATYSAVSARV